MASTAACTLSVRTPALDSSTNGAVGVGLVTSNMIEDAGMPFIVPSELPQHELLPGWLARFFHSEHMTFSYTEVAAQGSVHRHRHLEEEVWHIIEGDVEMSLGDATRVVHAGEAVVVPSDVEHSARAVTAFRAIVVDFPLRDSVAGVSTR
jgi:quercetin dioxygenase-like cupin family protein